MKGGINIIEDEAGNPVFTSDGAFEYVLNNCLYELLTADSRNGITIILTPKEGVIFPYYHTRMNSFKEPVTKILIKLCLYSDSVLDKRSAIPAINDFYRRSHTYDDGVPFEFNLTTYDRMLKEVVITAEIYAKLFKDNYDPPVPCIIYHTPNLTTGEIIDKSRDLLGLIKVNYNHNGKHLYDTSRRMINAFFEAAGKGVLVVAMEFFNGYKTMKDVLRHRKIHIYRKHVFMEYCRIIRLGIIHGDMTNGNILIQDNNEENSTDETTISIKLIDFGNAIRKLDHIGLDITPEFVTRILSEPDMYFWNGHPCIRDGKRERSNYMQTMLQQNTIANIRTNDKEYAPFSSINLSTSYTTYTELLAIKKHEFEIRLTDFRLDQSSIQKKMKHLYENIDELIYFYTECHTQLDILRTAQFAEIKKHQDELIAHQRMEQNKKQKVIDTEIKTLTASIETAEQFEKGMTRIPTKEASSESTQYNGYIEDSLAMLEGAAKVYIDELKVKLPYLLDYQNRKRKRKRGGGTNKKKIKKNKSKKINKGGRDPTEIQPSHRVEIINSPTGKSNPSYIPSYSSQRPKSISREQALLHEPYHPRTYTRSMPHSSVQPPQSQLHTKSLTNIQINQPPPPIKALIKAHKTQKLESIRVKSHKLETQSLSKIFGEGEEGLNKFIMYCFNGLIVF